MKKPEPKVGMTASQRISVYITELADWRSKRLAQVRKLVLETEPAMVEEWKWETPVWSHHGNVVAAGAFKDNVKLNFFKGASLPDPSHLFNAGLEAKVSRAIDMHEHDKLNEPALKELIRAAVAQNAGKPKSKK